MNPASLISAWTRTAFLHALEAKRHSDNANPPSLPNPCSHRCLSTKSYASGNAHVHTMRSESSAPASSSSSDTVSSNSALASSGSALASSGSALASSGSALASSGSASTLFNSASTSPSSNSTSPSSRMASSSATPFSTSAPPSSSNPPSSSSQSAFASPSEYKSASASGSQSFSASESQKATASQSASSSARGSASPSTSSASASALGSTSKSQARSQSQSQARSQFHSHPQSQSQSLSESQTAPSSSSVGFVTSTFRSQARSQSQSQARSQFHSHPQSQSQSLSLSQTAPSLSSVGVVTSFSLSLPPASPSMQTRTFRSRTGKHAIDAATNTPTYRSQGPSATSMGTTSASTAGLSPGGGRDDASSSQPPSPSFSSSSTEIETQTFYSSIPSGHAILTSTPSARPPVGSDVRSEGTSTSATSTAGLSGGAGRDDGFAHNVGGIIGVSLGCVVVVILSVVLLFFLCGRLGIRSRSPIFVGARRAQGPQMLESGSITGLWRSPLENEDDTESEEYTATSVGHWGESSSEGHETWTWGGAGGGEGTSSETHGGSSETHTHAISSSSGHMPFAQTRETLAFADGTSEVAWLAGRLAAGTPASQGYSKQVASSQGHSGSSNSHDATGSSNSHGQGSSPTSPGPPPASSPPSSYSQHLASTSPSQASPPTSYVQHTSPFTQPELEEDRASPKRPGLLGRLRSRLSSSPSTSPTLTPPAFEPGALQDPTSPASSGCTPSSLLNPLPASASWTARRRSSGIRGGWRPPAAAVYSLPSLSTLTDDGDGETREGLLRPGLAVLLGPTHSTRTLGDDVDYSRPIGARLDLRMDSGATCRTTTSSSEGDRS